MDKVFFTDAKLFKVWLNINKRSWRQNIQMCEVPLYFIGEGFL